MSNLRNATHISRMAEQARVFLHTSRGITPPSEGLGRRTLSRGRQIYRWSCMPNVVHIGDPSGRRRRGAHFPNQLGPDAVPITRPEIPAHHVLVGGPLNRHAVLGAGETVFVTVLPLANLGNVLDANGGSEGRDAHGALGIEVSEKVHRHIVVANATSMQAAFATPAIATLAGMDNDAIKKHRIARLEAAIKERFDESAADLAAALGLKNAAFLRQMISGHRPITEKTIAKIEALKGMAGWFGLQVMTADGTPMVLTFDEVDAVMGIRAAKAAREAAPSNVSQFPPPPPPAPSGGMRSVSRLGAQAAKKTSKRKGGA